MNSLLALAFTQLFGMGIISNMLQSNQDLVGKISYTILADNIAVSDVELQVNSSIYQQYKVEEYNKSGVFLAVDKSGSMGTLLGTQKRIEVVQNELLSIGKAFFDKNSAKNMTLYMVFFDDQVVSQGFKDFTSFESFVQENSMPGGDTGFYLALQEILRHVKEDQLQHFDVYLLSDGQDSYPKDTALELSNLKTYINENSIYSRFSTIGIAQPDTQLMSEIINIGALVGDYVYVDERLAQDSQIKQINTFYNNINKEVFSEPTGITVTILNETVFLPQISSLDISNYTVFKQNGHFFNQEGVEINLQKLEKVINTTNVYQKIALKKKKIAKEENKDLLVVYNDVCKLNFELTRELLKEEIKDIKSQIDGNLRDKLSRSTRQDYSYIEGELKSIEAILLQDSKITLGVIERGDVEQLRNQILQRFETKQLEIFDPNDDGEDTPSSDDDDYDKDPKRELRIMKYIIGSKHFIELVLGTVIFFFYLCPCNKKFLAFKYCQIYVFVIYFILLVQDFILLAPPIWIFVYHVTLIMIIFIVSLRKRDIKEDQQTQQQRETEQQQTANQYVQINEENEEIEVREQVEELMPGKKEDNDAFTASYKKAYNQSSSLKKIVFNAFLVLEFFMSITIIVFAFF